jgi:hypothetical protein
MRSNSLQIRSWTFLLVATLMWAGTIYFIVVLVQMEGERARYAAEAAEANVQQGQAAQLRVLARETQQERSALEKISNIDVLSAVNLIESIGASSTSVRVESAHAVKTTAKAGANQMNVVDLYARTEGSFSYVMNVIKALENIPLPAAIQQVDLSHSPIESNSKLKNDIWQLNIRLRFYTTSTLST